VYFDEFAQTKSSGHLFLYHNVMTGQREISV
jgi:hypothetical protein